MIPYDIWYDIFNCQLLPWARDKSWKQMKVMKTWRQSLSYCTFVAVLLFISPMSACHVFTLLWFSVLNRSKLSHKSRLVFILTLIFKVIQCKMAYWKLCRSFTLYHIINIIYCNNHQTKNKKVNTIQMLLEAPCWSRGPQQALSLRMPWAGSARHHCSSPINQLLILKTWVRKVLVI